MSNPLIGKPHVYKKGKILNLKPLDEGLGKGKINYVFSSSNPNIATVSNHCNNINQILGRTYLGISKLLSYFGLSQDPSEKNSKTPSVFNKFSKTYFSEGGSNKELKPLLQKIDNRLFNLEPRIEKLDPEIKRLQDEIEKLKPSKEEKPVSRSEILDFTQKLTEIQRKLDDILGT